MQKIIINDQHIPYNPGISLRKILDSTHFRVRTACRGTGSCGLCKVIIEEGKINEPTQQEILNLSKDLIEKGIRLACQVFPTQDIKIRIENLAPDSSWRSLSENEYFCSPLENYFQNKSQNFNLKKSDSNSMGLAIDLGTTHISITLWDLNTKKRLTGRIGRNKQSIFGSDVMTRVIAAHDSTEQSNHICKLAIDSISQGIHDICSREAYDSLKINLVTIVGNTPEIALLTQNNYNLLLQPKYWTEKINCETYDTKSWCSTFNISPEAIINICPTLAGFVGSDLLACIVATDMTSIKQPSLLIDFGTNTEIALWDSKKLWITSAAGGPAFEANGMTCGMTAKAGAIYHFEKNLNNYKVILNTKPKGICGSGFVDLIANMIENKIINEKGKFTCEKNNNGYAFLKEFPNIIFNLKDIDLFQRAKAAIGAGIQCLLQSAEINLNIIKKIYICGVFGRYLNISNAQKTGLLPKISKDSFQLCGNAALSGCEILLLSSDSNEKIQFVQDNSQIINMADYSKFEEFFLNNLYLRPMEF